MVREELGEATGSILFGLAGVSVVKTLRVWPVPDAPIRCSPPLVTMDSDDGQRTSTLARCCPPVEPVSVWRTALRRSTMRRACATTGARSVARWWVAMTTQSAAAMRSGVSATEARPRDATAGTCGSW